MDIGLPPPPPLFFATPQADVSNSNHSSSPSSPSPISSIVILIIILSSVIIVSATVYLLTRFFSRRRHVTFRTTFSPSDDVVYNNRNRNENEHVITVGNDGVESLPLFTFSSLTGNIAGGDCAVCLSKFEGADQLRLLPLCCHAFHVECIDSWLKSNMTCPLCRSPVNPSEADIMNKISASGNTSNSFRIEIGTVSQRRDPSESDRISYSIGSFEYVLDDGYEISVESTHRTAVVDKDSVNPDPPVQNSAAEIGGGGDGGGSRNWLRDYVDRVSVSLSSRTLSFRGSGRFFTGSSRRSEDFEATNSRIGEEISEFFRWFSGV